MQAPQVVLAVLKGFNDFPMETLTKAGFDRQFLKENLCFIDERISRITIVQKLPAKTADEPPKGRIRRTYPKGTDFIRMTQKEMMEFLLNFNQDSRKVLNYNMAFEVFISFWQRLT